MACNGLSQFWEASRLNWVTSGHRTAGEVIKHGSVHGHNDSAEFYA